MTSESKLPGNFSVFLVILIAIISIALKFNSTSQALPYTNVSDIQHVNEAFKYIEEYNTSGTLPTINYQTKYPTLTTYIYLIGMKFTDIWTYPHNMKLIRDIHVLFFVLSAVLLLLFPIDKKLKILSLFLYSLSMTGQFYSVIERIHGPTGAMTFLALFFIIKLIKKETFSPILFFIANISCGLAMSTFFTGIFSWVSLVSALFLLHRDKKIRKRTAWILTAMSLGICLFIFTIFYPSFYTFLLGENSLFLKEHFGHYFGEDTQRFKGFKDTYTGFGLLTLIENIFGWDPLLWAGYFLGLLCLFKNRFGEIKEWIPMLVIIIPYQLMMLTMATYQTRRDMFFLPIMALISAYGWLWLLKKDGKIKYVFAIVSFFMLMSITRYHTLALKNTQSEIFSFVKEQIPEDSYVVVSDRLPPFTLISEDRYTENPKELNLIDINGFRELIKRRLDKDPRIVAELFNKFGLSHDCYQNEDLHPQLFYLFYIDYLIINLTEEESDLKSTKSIRKSTNLYFQSTDESEKEKSILAKWPDTAKWPLWKIWNANYSGPQIAIYRMPWAHE